MMRFWNLLLIISVTRIACSTTNESVCGKDKLLCGDGSKCIKPIKLCDYTPDCEDASDETNFELCKKLSPQRTNCPDLNFLKIRCSADYSHQEFRSYAYLQYQCMDIFSACSLGNKCLGLADHSICPEIAGRLLKPSEVIKERTVDVPEYDNNFYEMVDFISESFTEIVNRNFTSCPSFFTFFKGKCYSFFLPAQITWSEAKLFCESIMSSRLAVLDDIHKFKAVLDYIKLKGLKSNFWIGGHTIDDLKDSTKKWTWLNTKPVKMGAPFWSLSLVDPTLNYVCDKVVKSIRPRNENPGKMCMALLESNHYYFSDEKCHERLSPICVLK